MRLLGCNRSYLLVAPGVQGSEQAVQCRIANNTQGQLPRILVGGVRGARAESARARAHSGSFGMLTSDDCDRRGGDLLGHREIEADAGERLVEASLVDLAGVGDALDARDQLVAGAEGKIFVQVLVAIDIYLSRELAITGCGDKEMNARRPDFHGVPSPAAASRSDCRADRRNRLA